MKAMVTGGAGFVGTNLIKRLLKDGYEVVSIDNYSTGKEENHQEGCVYHGNRYVGNYEYNGVGKKQRMQSNLRRFIFSS